MKTKISKRYYLLCWMLILLWTLAGCFPGAGEKVPYSGPLKRISPGAYPSFEDHMEFSGLIAALDQSLLYFSRVPKERKYRYAEELYTASHLTRSLETFRAFLRQNPSAKEMNRFIRSRYLVYESIGSDEGRVLYTGYYEPIYPGSRTRSEAYPYPLYARPDDLVEIDLSAFSDAYRGHKRLMARVDGPRKKVVPYYSREQINLMQDFDLRSKPVVWLENRVDRFFLEIQGSGRVSLDTGEQVRIHYSSKNGNAYRSVGRYLIEQDEIEKEKMSMQAIREWLERHPERMDEVLHYNESFVFFKEEQGGPYGSLGVEVTAFRSIATDSSLFPKGGLCFIKTQLPDRVNINPLKQWEKSAFFAMNQDTGGAIKGPGRADIFCGNGHYAEFTAGHMNTRGRLFFLVLKEEK